jgi:hypothetical protein
MEKVATTTPLGERVSCEPSVELVVDGSPSALTHGCGYTATLMS